MSPLLWTCASTRTLADALIEMGHDLSYIRLWAGCWSIWVTASRPTARPRKGRDHPDRNAQFEQYQRSSPLVPATGSAGGLVPDTKKKEIVGNYKNPGREWEPDGQPRRVKSKDFPDKQLGKVCRMGSTI